jgi:hypothetical protein
MKINYMVFIISIVFILKSINIESTCIIKPINTLPKCNIFINVKGDTQGLNYNLDSYGVTNSMEECCQNCIQLKSSCTFFGYFDESQLCLYFNGLNLNELSLSQNNGTSIGAPNV